jgi:Golgi nucleoside diphosphatase
VVFCWVVAAACCWAARTPELQKVKPTVSRGIVIDAGSGGSRLHVYEWKPRVFNSTPPRLSYPESNEHWTARIGPGVATFADNLGGIYGHLKPLMDFATKTLSAEGEDLSEIPIYFYATGGVRLLSTPRRDAVIDTVRDWFDNSTFCPFFFHRHFARVISGTSSTYFQPFGVCCIAYRSFSVGEEEAIFSWAATNFLMNTLLPASQGEGVVQGVNSTYGTIDLGGASTQIAYFLPSQDILEGLFKFQIGNQKIWNVYTKSFLSFGVVSARQRHIRSMVDEYLSSLPNGSYDKHSTDLSFANPCFYSGYSETVKDTTGKVKIQVTGPVLPQKKQLKECLKSVRPLMEKKHNAFCEEVYHGDCSIAGSYQPPLPDGQHGKFIGTSQLTLVWRFLQLPATASMEELKAAASSICQMNFDDIMFYYEVNFSGDSNSVVDALPYFCFLSSYVITLLEGKVPLRVAAMVWVRVAV